MFEYGNHCDGVWLKDVYLELGNSYGCVYNMKNGDSATSNTKGDFRDSESARHPVVQLSKPYFERLLKM